MSKIKTETKKQVLLKQMALDRDRFLAGQRTRIAPRAKARGVSSVEGMLLNALFSVGIGKRLPVLVKKPLQALALSWLQGRFGTLAQSALKPVKPSSPKLLFAGTHGADDLPIAVESAADYTEQLQRRSVDELRRISNELNAAIADDRLEDVKNLSEALKVQVGKTRLALDNAAASAGTPVDHAWAWTRVQARKRPWAAVGTGAGAGYAAGLALALVKRWQTRRALQRDAEREAQRLDRLYREAEYRPRYRAGRR